MNIGILGLGYWGPNLVRNFLNNSNVEKVIGSDKEPDRLNFIKQRYPSVELVQSFDDLLSKNVDAIAIATPVKTHYEFAKKAMKAGKHIWVEKPFTANTDEAKDLIEISKATGVKIFVDHTFIYTGAIKKIKELIDSNELGDIIYFDSVRINLGLFQHDVNVIWDLAPHDLSIMNYLIPQKRVSAVTANGIANYYDHENIAHISIHFENKRCFGHFHVNWTSPVKIRRMIIVGTKKMLVFDDMENFEKIKVYDSGIEFLNTEKIHKALVQYRIGDMYSPKVAQTEALAYAVKEFISAIKENRMPLTNAYDGLNVVQILEAASKSIKNDGDCVELNNLFKINNYTKDHSVKNILQNNYPDKKRKVS